MNTLMALIVSLCLALMLGVSHALMKVISMSPEQSIVDAYIANFGKLAAALAIYFGLFCIYPFILRFFPMSIIFPAYTGFSIFVVMLAGALFFEEPVNSLQYLGAVLLVTGIALITVTGGAQS